MVRVLVVDDEPLVRAGLRLVLDPARGIEIVGEAGDGVAAVRAARELAPDVVLMDVRMPGGDGIAAVTAIRAAGLGCRILMLTAFDTDEFVLGALRAGADGFLLKAEDPDLIERAVLGAAAGTATVSAPVLRRLVGLAAPLSEPAGVPAGVSGREWDVARLVAQGRSNAEISTVLHLSLATVKTHLGSLFAKLGLDNRVQLAILVLEREPSRP
ncbi:response regulator transcription factor [Nocardioides sp. WV_118_6]|uniref:response regulator n=1 Tax=Nocardioides simplex TaxID=2045 RepID=UPI002150536D|nr:response regulator transcription factor [Pimelobacter simplex]UUW89643.1 response regulator transcription factor [Pimelobacter simplex]UUW93472.1 response regulator transcription factor [Pimelobacter simplex]